MTVGTKVVCIDDRWPQGIENLYIALPVAGRTYTIREVSPGICPVTMQPEISVRLMELRNPRSNIPPHMERGFKIERFRPLDEQHDELVEQNVDAVGTPMKLAA